MHIVQAIVVELELVSKNDLVDFLRLLQLDSAVQVQKYIEEATTRNEQWMVQLASTSSLIFAEHKWMVMYRSMPVEIQFKFDELMMHIESSTVAEKAASRQWSWPKEARSLRQLSPHAYKLWVEVSDAIGLQLYSPWYPPSQSRRKRKKS